VTAHGQCVERPVEGGFAHAVDNHIDTRARG
jgi:hypothetical protein